MRGGRRGEQVSSQAEEGSREGGRIGRVKGTRCKEGRGKRRGGGGKEDREGCYEGGESEAVC